VITYAESETPGWVWMLFIAAVVVIVVTKLVVPFVRAFMKRVEELRLEDRKEAVRKFCRERGFEPNENDLHAVVTGKGMVGAKRDS
jgi:hypothetical protein